MVYLARQPNFGRVVEIETKQQFEELLRRGFTPLSDAEKDEFYFQRAQKIEGLKHQSPKDCKLEVYFKTVNKRGDGYGMSSFHIVREMRKLGVFLNTEYRGQKIGLLYHRPEGVLQMQNDIRVIYTMFESTKTPRPMPTKEFPEPVSIWKESCEMADKVLVPSTFVQGVFAKDEIETDVVPLGYNQELFKLIERPIPSEERKDFTFLHYNAFNARKGFIEVWKAFLKAFPPKDKLPVKLILKSTMDRPPMPISKRLYPNVEVITGDVPEEELISIIGRSHCFIFPSRGEGFGITPLEAMATGIPAIVPNAHGIGEYFDRKYMYEAKIKAKCPGLYHAYKGMDTGHMVVCDENSIARQMKWIFNHQKEALEKGREAAEYVKQWSYANTAKKLAEVLFELDKKTINKRRDLDVLGVEII